MNFSEFYTETLSLYHQENDGSLRLGRFLMYRLRKVKRRLYHAVPWDIDPYYGDKFLDACCEWLRERWAAYYEIKDDGMPSSDDRDIDGFCWWGWAHSPGHGNPRFWQASWAYSKEPMGATHWAPHWTFPVIK